MIAAWLKDADRNHYAALIAKWSTQSPEDLVATPELMDQYERNRKLIDFEHIPKDVSERL